MTSSQDRSMKLEEVTAALCPDTPRPMEVQNPLFSFPETPTPPKPPTFLPMLSDHKSQSKRPAGLFEQLLNKRTEILLEDSQLYPNDHPDIAVALIQDLYKGTKNYENISLDEQLLLDESNPRSVIYQVNRLQKHIANLPRDRRSSRLSKEERLVLEAATLSGVSIPQAEGFFSPRQVIALENDFPKLKFDPWWLRFKALKIAFGTPNLVPGVSDTDIVRFSKTIDFAFALHIRLSDVFTKPGDNRKFEKHREQVLKRFLDTVFPENSDSRTKLNATFIGDVSTVSDFEKELRDLFLNSVDRIREKIKKIDMDISDQHSQEFEIWHHYYEKSFKPKPNVVQKCILNHLQVPRGRLQIGFLQQKGWFFRSLQRGQTVGKRFESSILNLLPEEITLVDNSLFLKGLVYCVVNGYYGIFNQGMLNETKTEVEYDRKHTNLGSKFDNQLAFIRPDQIERIMKQILALFGDGKISYLDCIRKSRSINELMIFLNLLKYGRISFLYRDNLNTIYVDEFDIPRFMQHVDEYIASYDKMLRSRSLHVLMAKFFATRGIEIGKVKLKVWVNSNSVETTHAATKYEAKETDLAEHFHQLILKIHQKPTDLADH